MPVDVRINEVTTDVNATDASALLTPQILDRIVKAVMMRMQQHRQNEQEMQRERSLGSARTQAGREL